MEHLIQIIKFIMGGDHYLESVSPASLKKNFNSIPSSKKRESY